MSRRLRGSALLGAVLVATPIAFALVAAGLEPWFQVTVPASWGFLIVAPLMPGLFLAALLEELGVRVYTPSGDFTWTVTTVLFVTSWIVSSVAVFSAWVTSGLIARRTQRVT